MISLNNDFNIDDLEDFILKWNLDFPIDRWWRKKHGVIFNSSVHREVSFIDMFVEFLEDSLYEDLKEKKTKQKEAPYVMGSKNFLFAREVSQEMTDEEFNDIELEELP